MYQISFKSVESGDFWQLTLDGKVLNVFGTFDAAYQEMKVLGGF